MNTSGVPVIASTLDRSFIENRGLVTGLDQDGFPHRQGGDMDPTVVESRRFYDTLQAPNAVDVMVDYPDPFTGAPPGLRKTAPLTFDAWKETFDIPARNPGESLAEYRARTNVVIYYNKNELGLGRELGCAEFDDGVDREGNPLTGVACYVTNYGTAFRDMHNSLRIAGEGVVSKNTVCISWRPSMDPDYQVQFYVYNGDGKRIEWAQLDTLGPRPLPQVCMNCHGGVYDAERHLAKYARFLPMDPNVVVFAEPGSPGSAGVTRADQEEAIRIVNELSTRSPLTSLQIEMLDQLYEGKLTTQSALSKNVWAPAGWNGNAADRQLFDEVIKPNCTTCHAAMQNGLDGSVLPIYDLFGEPGTLLEANLPGVVCGTFQMPNSQATLLNFWEPGAAPLTFDGVQFDTAADVLLAKLGSERSRCANFAVLSDCNRGEDPDELCGNAFSGKACNRNTGRCVPELGFLASTDPTAPNGFCRMDGSRKCPYPEECRLAKESEKVPGVVGFDGVCVP